LATTLVDRWGKVDDTFVGSWEKWMGPVGASDADLTAQISGDLSNQIARRASTRSTPRCSTPN
jgi:hypothetical protein